MLVDGMEDLDDFGTDEEEEDERPRGKRAARVDSDIDEEDEEPTKAPSRPVARASAAPKQPTSKRKRDSDANGRTPKRTRVTEGGDDQSEGGNSTNGLTEKEDGAMNQDSQGEETLEVEQNLFSASDEDSFATPRWAILPSRPFPRTYLPVDHTADPTKALHQHDPPRSSDLAGQWHPLPKTTPPSSPVNKYTDRTVPKTLPRVPSQRSTLMTRTRTRQSSPSVFESELCQKSSKVRSDGTSNLARLKYALTRHQSSSLLSRSVQHGSPWLWGTRKLIQPGTICLGKNCASFNVILPNPNLRLHLHRNADPWNHVAHPLRAMETTEKDLCLDCLPLPTPPKGE